MKKIVYTLTLILVFLISNADNLPEGFKEQKNGIAFTENKGQMHDQNYKPRPDVLFGAMAGNMAFHLKTTGVSYQLYRVDKQKEVEDAKTKEKRKEIDQQTVYRIDLNWLNANKNFAKTTDQTLEGFNNYYTVGCPEGGALNVKSYSGVTLHNLYNGINLHYYDKDGQLKHDYIVAPHTDYKQIQLKVEGASVSVNKDGSLLFTTPLGKIQEGAPIVYQNGKQLKAKWVIKTDGEQSRTISFEIENYNANEELIIDPVTRLWGTYYGGTGIDRRNSCTTDVTGNVYLAGETNSNTGTVIATTGAHQTVFGGNIDAFLVKFNSNGVRQWSTYYGDTGSDIGYSSTTDGFGNVYLAGRAQFSTGTVVATAGAHQTVNGGVYDAFLVKFNSSGLRQWGTHYGGTGSEEGHSCATDGSGNVYLSGYTSSNTGTIIATTGAHQTVNGGGNDAFLVKFNSSGVRQWGTYCGGTAADEGQSCDVDATGNVYLAGYTSSSGGTSIATAGSHQIVTGGSVDAFLVKFNSSGVRQWGTFYGGTGIELGFSCATDATGSVYLTGYTQSTNGISTTGAHQNLIGGSDDAFLVKFSSAGVRQFGTYFGGTGPDQGFSCVTDAMGNVYLAGYTGSTNDIATAGSHQSAFGGGLDGFLAKFNSVGVRQFGTYYGGTATDEGLSCATDAAGNVYLAGFAGSNNGIATAGAHQTVFGGGYDGFLVKFYDCVSLNPIASTSAALCAGATINLSANITGTSTPTYSWAGPNSYTASVQNPSIANASTLNVGIYTVTIDNGGCVETATTQVSTVNPLPTVSVNSGTICSGNSFTMIPSGANTYTIQGGNAVVSPTTSSSYTVIGTSSLGCVSQTFATSSITVNASPTISVISGAICSGNNFTINPSGANTYTIQGGNAIVSPTANVTYTVVGTSNAGCVSQTFATCNITVNPLPTVSVNSGAICLGNSFTIIPSGASTYTIQGGNAVVSPTISSSYTVVGTSSLGCVSQTIATSSITVNELPIVSASTSNSILCVGETATLTGNGASTYTFSPGGSGTSIAISPTVTSIYTVTGTDVNACMNSTTITQSVSACTSLSEIANSSNELIVYPNPFNNKITIVSNSKKQVVQIFNALGTLILKTETENEKIEIELSNESSGIYFIKVGTEIKKIIKE